MGHLEPQLTTRLVTLSDGAQCMALFGELDVYSGQVLAAALANIPADKSFVLDLAAVTFVDSTGLSLLVGRWKQACEAGATFHLHAVPDNIMRLLVITGLDKLISIE